MKAFTLGFVFCSLLVCSLFQLFAGGKGLSAAAEGKEFYVSPRGKDADPGTLQQPFQTVERARDAVRTLRHEGRTPQPVTVYLREGTYALPSPLIFRPEDGGSAASPVSYRAYRNERPLISGGNVITGWKSSRRGDKEVWVAELPEVRSGRLFFRELWADGQRRTRARHPDKGYRKVAAVPDVTPKPLWSDGSTSFQFSPEDIPAGWTYTDAMAVVMNRWTESHLPISRIDRQAGTIHFSKRSVFTLDKGDDFYLENVPEAMDAPGEWYLDRRRGEVYYMPMPGETIGATHVMIPVLSQLVRLEGDPERGKLVEHMTFDRIAFSYVEWNLPDTLNFRVTFKMADTSAVAGVPDGGYPQAAYDVPGAVYARGARHVTFDRCEIAHVGTYGIELSRGCSDNRILGCTLTDLGAGGVKIGETVIRPAASDRTGRNDVIGCTISNGGLVYHSAIGVWVAQSADNRIMHNTVHDFYYSGFSLGWTWGYTESAAKGNIVENNHVHHIGVRSNGDGPILSDMAGIYTLGIQPGTVIRRNIFHDIAGIRYGGWGIYFDEGSTDILAEDNLVYRTTHGGFHQHYGRNNIVRNNIFAFARDYQIQRSRAEDHLSFTFEGNIVYWKEGKAAAGNFSGSHFRMDNNIYWKEGDRDIRFDSLTFAEWQKFGRDLKSVIMDPGLEDPGAGNFTFKKDSPALKRGFRPFTPGPDANRFGGHRDGVGAGLELPHNGGRDMAAGTTHAAGRRVLYNMDGTDLFFYHDTMSPAELCWRVDEVADAGVTTYLFSPNPGQNMGYPSAVCDMFQYTLPETSAGRKHTTSDSIFARIGGNLAHLVKRGYDPTGTVVDRARRRGLETFLTFRMNELHDVDVPGSPLLSKFWKEHPEYRVGGYEGWGAYALNYAEPAVRDYYFALLEEVCTRYDIDGLELDFMRFPYYFPNDSLKRKEYTGIMTSFIRRVRAMTEARAKERGRPLLLTARVPSTLQGCAHLGVDAAAWAKERLIDFLAVAPFLSTEMDIPVGEFKRACPGIPIYTAIEYTLGEQPMTREMTRAAAATLYASGADGIYSFNHFCQRELGPEDFDVFAEISRPEALHGKSKLYAVSAARYPVPDVSMKAQLPVTVGPGRQGVITLQTPEASRPGAVAIRIESDSSISGEQVTVALNGKTLRRTSALSTGLFPDRYWRGREIPADRCVEFAADPSILRDKNQIAIHSKRKAKITRVYLAAVAGSQDSVRTVKTIPATEQSKLYTSNRAPLLPSPLIKLPIGSIVPAGLIKSMLELEAGGMTGHLAEISKWCKFEGNAWSDPSGAGHSGWEELPYWLKGYGDLGYVLRDPTIIAESKKWVEQILKSQDSDGWFGPKGLKESLKGKPDLWPNMIVLNILQSYYEYTADPRILPFMTNYFRWELNCPDSLFLTGFWPRMRAGDNIESVYWLYNRTGEPWLLDVAKKIHEHTADWTGGIPTWHGVNIAQGFREPAVYYMQAQDASFLHAAKRNYDTVMALYGQVPGGMFAADENARPGFADPRQGAETCTMVEFMHSFEMLTVITGDPLWADRCEEVAYNSFPPALTPDMKALHYITSPNAVLLDKESKAPGLENNGTMLSYSPYAVYRCCQHNVAHGWPYFTENLWLATPDGGLCASLYGANSVKAKVGTGTNVRIEEQTDYPFSGTVKMHVKATGPVRFPLYLRVPRWSRGASVRINGKPAQVKAVPLSYIVIDRLWRSGDNVELELPMEISVRRWAENKNATSVDYGPLSYSLKIGEQWKRYGGTDAWPELEVHPTSPWNYGLVLDEKNPAGSFRIVRKEGPIASQPFTPETAPIELEARARKIPAWTTDSTGLVQPLQLSPAVSDEPVETVRLVPMGCARLRISAFPVIGTGPDAQAWVRE